jgi:hypothetical protein
VYQQNVTLGDIRRFRIGPAVLFDLYIFAIHLLRVYPLVDTLNKIYPMASIGSDRFSATIGADKSKHRNRAILAASQGHEQLDVGQVVLRDLGDFPLAREQRLAWFN